MTRAPWWAAPVGWALLVAVLMWWGPSIVLEAGALAAGRLRFLAASGLVDLLRALGCQEAARAVLRHELRRAEKRMAGAARRRQP